MDKDLFDRIIDKPIFNKFKPFYYQHREIILYLLFGGIAFFLNFFLFIAINDCLSIDELINNIICWIICVLFQFFTNSIWVFKNKISTIKEFIRQLSLFFGGRIFTLIIEEIGIYFFITVLNYNISIVKLCIQVVVIILNYILSKVIVFKKRGNIYEI